MPGLITRNLPPAQITPLTPTSPMSVPRPLRSFLPTAFLALVLAAALSFAPGAAAQEGSEFGSSELSGAALIGILYDLKQDQSRKPMKMDTKAYGQVVDEFIGGDWDENVLNRYFRAARPLYTTQVFIPLISASAAPKAFGVEDIVRPMYWLVHYKGQVAAPTSGTWRFWGYGEEVCSVAINGRNVLLSNWREITTPSVNWKSPEPPGQPAASGHLRAGDWIELEAGQIVDIDILIGERGGGVFAAYLLIEKLGENYPRINGHPILPVFQLAPRATPQPKGVKFGPVIAPDGPVWIGRQ
jgi:hypothetical protein